MIKLKHNNKAFTLVELLAVFIILGIIATIAIVALRGIKVDYEKSTYEESVKSLLTAAQQKYAEDGYTGIMVDLDETDYNKVIKRMINEHDKLRDNLKDFKYEPELDKWREIFK